MTQLIDAAEHAGNTPLVEFLINMELNVEPIQPMFDLAKELKEQGHTLYIASNIAKRVFDELCKTRPTLFESFNLEHPQLLDAANVHANGTLIKKPDHEFFEQFVQRNHITPNECIVIDNKKANVDAAQRVGLKGIVFNKEISQLRQVLKEEHGIAV
jgi:FMN phosphatase YigB (HAD superfamily)